MAITRVQFKHQYLASSGTGYAFTSNNTAGNLLVLYVSSSWNGGAAQDFTVSDTAGNTWVKFNPKLFKASTGEIQVFYVLSCIGGANTVTVTQPANSAGDMGWTAIEYNASGGATWAVDATLTAGSSFDGSTVAGTTSFRTNAWSTAGGTNVILMGLADEQNTQATHTTVPANFSEINFDNTHVDAQAEWLDATAQTNVQSGWDVATSCDTYGLYVVAFTATATGTTPTTATDQPPTSTPRFERKEVVAY